MATGSSDLHLELLVLVFLVTNVPAVTFLSLLLRSGCTGMWDKIACWPSADLGAEVTIPCPKYLFFFSGDAQPRKSRACASIVCARAMVVSLRASYQED